jgi:hypothetical protein
MESKEYDFTRNAVVQSDVFFLQSKCADCGFSIPARSIEEVVEQEAAHRTDCRSSNSAAEARMRAFLTRPLISDYAFSSDCSRILKVSRRSKEEG